MKSGAPNKRTREFTFRFAPASPPLGSVHIN